MLYEGFCPLYIKRCDLFGAFASDVIAVMLVYILTIEYKSSSIVWYTNMGALLIDLLCLLGLSENNTVKTLS